MRILGAVAIVMALSSCATVDIPQLDAGTNYQRDLRFDVQYWRVNKKKWTDKEKFTGVGVIEKSDKYKITVYPVGKADMITLSNCHREHKRANPKTNWRTKGVPFEFTPIVEHESEKTCPIDAGIYEKKKGRHGWASMVIDSERENLAATLKCNGEIIKTTVGTSYCQAKRGLVQSIHFDRDVEVAQYPGCLMKTPPKGYGKDWTYVMPSGRCVFFFIDRNDPDNVHKSAHFGYDTIPIRGVE